MEKMPGIKLATVWDSMHNRNKLEVVKQLVQYDRGVVTTHFPAYGGLYYPGDVREAAIPMTHQESNERAEGRFVIGPTNSRKYFDDGRATLLLDRGPCELL